MAPVETPEKLPRPPQVTLVGWLIVVGSVFVAFSAFEAFSAVRSLDTREAIDGYLDGPGKSLGWSVEQGIQAVRISALVTAACAAAAAVLGFFALRRDRGARIGLAVLALPLFLSGVVAGGFVSSMVAAAAVLLWMQPARDWFNGKPMAVPPPAQRGGLFGGPGSSDPTGSTRGRQGEPHEGHGHGHPQAPLPPGPNGEVGQAGRPVQGCGALPPWERPPADPYSGPQPYGTPPTQGQPHGQLQGQVQGEVPPYAQPHVQVGDQRGAPTGHRPGAVLWAVVLTLVFGGFSLLSSLFSLVVALAAPGTLVDDFLEQQPELVEQGVTRDQVEAALLFSGAVLTVLSLCAVIAALLVLFRREGGLPILVLIAGGSAVFCLLATFVVPFMLLPGLASVAVVTLLLRPEVRAWLKGGR